ncbi:TetR/AcrR family transcriptional regulator [Actinacidiphila alni]|uniref:TetR/AcrR family transcriptional regulator n=1 Tax=Actinacidiphila alni TaxID=380248 RepID=UPI0015A58369|nr:TetR/AcrR family transcriptional regulator C-terminal domain-containing protein [Actinacidiphila alni]
MNRDELISTALAVADSEGLDAVTIRRVAQQHDVTPMALYRHFPDKDGLFDAVTDRLLTDVRVPEADQRPWHEQMNDLLSIFLAALRPHPNAAPLVITRLFTSEPGLAITERTLALLSEAGMPVEEAAQTAGQALCSLVTLVITEPGRSNPALSPEDRAAEVSAKEATLSALSPTLYPHVVEAAAALSSCASDDRYYRRGIDMIVAGMRGTAQDAFAH